MSYIEMKNSYKIYNEGKKNEILPIMILVLL